jgi:hypothetical protein
MLDCADIETPPPDPLRALLLVKGVIIPIRGPFSGGGTPMSPEPFRVKRIEGSSGQVMFFHMPKGCPLSYQDTSSLAVGDSRSYTVP